MPYFLEYIHRLIFHVENIEQLIRDEEHYAIFTLLDLFYHNHEKVLRNSVENNIFFLKRTYPILYIVDEPSSFIENAARFYWALIRPNHNDSAKNAYYNSENIYWADKFKNEHKAQYSYLLGDK